MVDTVRLFRNPALTTNIVYCTGLYYDTQEILPFLSGDHRFNKAGDKIAKFSSLEVEVRAVIEGQFIAKRVYAEDMGLKIGPFNSNTL